MTQVDDARLGELVGRVLGDLGGASAAGPLGKDPEQVAALPPQNA